MGARQGPLAGLKVIEMAGLAPGPFAAMMLADMGAQVLRIDRFEPERRAMPQRFYLTDRNRRSIALDLKSAQGRAVVKRLIAGADALIEGFRPGVMERLGLGPEECLQIHPKLVYGRMTGWGQDGPLALTPGHDINYLALSGALEAIGEAGRAPVLPLNLVGDFGGGAMYLAFGIACGLIEAARSGKGQVVDAAMVDGAASLMTYFYGHLAGGKWPGRGRSVTGGGAPFYAVYETSDGKYISIGSAEPKFYAELLRVLGLDTEGLPDRQDPAHWPVLRERSGRCFAAARVTNGRHCWPTPRSASRRCWTWPRRPCIRTMWRAATSSRSTAWCSRRRRRASRARHRPCPGPESSRASIWTPLLMAGAIQRQRSRSCAPKVPCADARRDIGACPCCHGGL
jgi:alpha-methylacyl-CoA racemase